MSEREIREIIRQFFKDYDEGKIRTSARAEVLRKLIVPPILGMALGLGIPACEEDYYHPVYAADFGVFNEGPVSDYYAPMQDKPFAQEGVIDVGGYPDNIAPLDHPKTQDGTKDLVEYPDHSAPFHDTKK